MKITIDLKPLEFEILKAAAKLRDMKPKVYAKALLIYFAGGSVQANQKREAKK
jgi:hypothetical protein